MADTEEAIVDLGSSLKLPRCIFVLGAVLLSVYQCFLSAAVQAEGEGRGLLSAMYGAPALVGGAQLRPNDDMNETSGDNKRVEFLTSPGHIVPVEKGFGACLIIMDDNHFLPEWLAYHYDYLPLRRLFVAVDPKSKTSPKNILARFHNRGLINVTLWSDEQFGFNTTEQDQLFRSMYSRKPEKAIVKTYIKRQRVFYAECMKQLRREGHSWVAMIDTDEYVLLNRFANQEHRLPSTGVRPTVLEMLNEPENRKSNERISRECIPMSRLNFGVRELNGTESIVDGVESFNPMRFNTFRWRYHIHRKRQPILGKCLVDVSTIVNESAIRWENVNPHRPILDLCSEGDVRLSNANSTFVVNQYTGTFEQWTYRQDNRTKRTREAYESFNYSSGPDGTDVQKWLMSLVNNVGEDTAMRLLRNSGRLAEFSNAAQSNLRLKRRIQEQEV